MKNIHRISLGKITLIISMALFLGSSAMLWGQETVGELNGVVKDASGAIVPGATVTITNMGTSRTSTYLTGDDGTYKASDLEPGRYALRFTKTGFTTTEVNDILVLVGRKTKMDVTLKVGQITEVVTVTGAASQLVDVTSTAVGHNVNEEEFDRLPKARSFQALMATSPSVTSGIDQFGNVVGLEGGIQVNGSSSAENQFYIDGVATNSQLEGQSRQNVQMEFVQEVQMKTGTPEAEYGGAMGGVASAITKSGGPEFHGDLHYYFVGNGIAAGPVQRLLNPLTVGIAGYNGTTTGSSNGFVQDQKVTDNRHELGGSLGGPILKDKMWFFISASPTWRRREVPYTLTDGTNTAQQKQFYQQTFAKINFDPTKRIRTNFSYLYTPTASTGVISAYNGGTNNLVRNIAYVDANKKLGFYAPQSNYRGSLEFTLTPKMVLNVAGGRFWDNYRASGIPNITTWEYGNSTTNLSPALQAQVAAAGLTGGSGFGNSPRQQLIDHDLVTRTFANADFSVLGKLWGFHNVKIGYGFSKGVNNVDNSYPQGGYITAFWGQAFQSTVPGSPCNTTAGCQGTYGYYTLDDLGTKGSTGGVIHSIYGQDNWKIGRVTFNYGFRFENEAVPSYRRAVLDPAFSFSFTDKFQPRVGAAYDVFGNGKLKVSFGFGRFYNFIPYELSRGTFGGDIWTTKYRALDTLNLGSLNAQNLPGLDVWDSRTPNSYQDHRIPAFGVGCSPTNLSNCQIDPSLKPMGVDQMNATVEYQLGTGMVFRASYVRSDLLHAIEDMGVLVEGSENYLYVNPGEGLLGQAMNINYAATKVPADLCRSKLSGTNLQRCLNSEVFPTPPAQRTYNALELSLTRRFSARFFFNASYVYSRLTGIYGGLSNTDEVRTPTTGGGYAVDQQQTTQISRAGVPAGRAWDLEEYMFDAHGNPYATGPLPTDRPHAFKLYGAYDFKFGTQLGLNFFAMSGTPNTTYAFTTDRVRMMVEGRGDLGRTPVLSQTDLLVGHDFKLTESKKLHIEFNMANLFNQKTARHIFNCLNYDCVNGQVASGMKMSNVNLFAGFDYNALIKASTNGQAYAAGTPGALNPLDPRYKKEDLWNPGFQGRFGVKFIF